MKNIFLSFLFAATALPAIAQEFQGTAVYESKTSTSEWMDKISGNSQITPDMQKMIEDRMKKMSEKTFILNFGKSTSIYKEEEKLDAPGTDGGSRRMMASVMGGGGTYYKDIKNKKFIVDREFMGKEFLVQDSLPKYEWKMESESRQIGGYTCYKATAVKVVDKSDFRNMGFKKEDKKDADKKASTSNSNIMDMLEMPDNVIITAWYTPEIPVSQGPESYYGLPGLILEINDGKTVILCSKVVLNPKEKVTIKAPTKGKTVSEKEYNKIVLEKMEELKQMNSAPGGGFRMGR